MQINSDVWQEILVWAHIVYHKNEEADLYDLFMRLREQQGNRPFTQNFIKTVDYEIAAEARRNARMAQN